VQKEGEDEKTKEAAQFNSIPALSRYRSNLLSRERDRSVVSRVSETRSSSIASDLFRRNMPPHEERRHYLAVIFFMLIFKTFGYAPFNFRTALQSGKWVKLINGASNQDTVLIRNLSFLYSLAGVDCIDISCDIAVLQAAREGIAAAGKFGSRLDPLVMISVNSDDDVHFRKAQFNPFLCPSDCPRPCEKICPANAIPPVPIGAVGVLEEKCYGCGRCIPSCPLGLIEEYPFRPSLGLIKDIVKCGLVDAIEIHTNADQLESFARLWGAIGDSVMAHLPLISISFPDMGAKTVPALLSMQSIMREHPRWSAAEKLQIFQTDGRPMSGDLGKGAVLPSLDLATKVLAAFSCSSGATIDFSAGRQFVQLSGGVSGHTLGHPSLRQLRGRTGFGGFGFGGFLRKEFSRDLRGAGMEGRSFALEDEPTLLGPLLAKAEKFLAEARAEGKD
jgi:Fe-S-cluster-containing hydrogenase component 2